MTFPTSIQANHLEDSQVMLSSARLSRVSNTQMTRIKLFRVWLGGCTFSQLWRNGHWEFKRSFSQIKEKRMRCWNDFLSSAGREDAINWKKKILSTLATEVWCEMRSYTCPEKRCSELERDTTSERKRHDVLGCSRLTDGRFFCIRSFCRREFQFDRGKKMFDLNVSPESSSFYG